MDPNSWKEEGAIGEDSSHTIPGASLGRQDLPSFCPSCVLETEEKGLNSASPLGKNGSGRVVVGIITGLSLIWEAVTRSPAYQLPFQVLGLFLGGPITVQYQWLPDPDCDVLTAYYCPWETI
jgi:hypothetical protein